MIGSVSCGRPGRNGWIDAPAEHPYNTTYAHCNPDAPLFVPFSMTRQTVISGIVVDQALADSDLVVVKRIAASQTTELSRPTGTRVFKESSSRTRIGQ
ncbi:hypothetical protein PHMEG_00026723 [Phytophthora megakarya]|uniref:Uncharacterized protein n=1 Tax=Phytophthora megakarya TaxID=4795 RepID=A0A225V8K9_9STRA|nr:hypothetical protein PHMEG_00026723 [Phytophthora megakarya]